MHNEFVLPVDLCVDLCHRCVRLGNGVGVEGETKGVWGFTPKYTFNVNQPLPSVYLPL